MSQRTVLRAAFLAGAVIDGAALLPMLVPRIAHMMWGLAETSAGYTFAMHTGAALMLGWTALLVWACLKPLERRFVAPLTVLVIWGMVLAEVAGVASGGLAASRMLPSWCIQAVLLCLFSAGYHYSTVGRVGHRLLAATAARG